MELNNLRGEIHALAANLFVVVRDCIRTSDAYVHMSEEKRAGLHDLLSVLVFDLWQIVDVTFSGAIDDDALYRILARYGKGSRRSGDEQYWCATEQMIETAREFAWPLNLPNPNDHSKLASRNGLHEGWERIEQSGLLAEWLEVSSYFASYDVAKTIAATGAKINAIEWEGLYIDAAIEISRALHDHALDSWFENEGFDDHEADEPQADSDPTLTMTVQRLSPTEAAILTLIARSPVRLQRVDMIAELSEMSFGSEHRPIEVSRSTLYKSIRALRHAGLLKAKDELTSDAVKILDEIRTWFGLFPDARELDFDQNPPRNDKPTSDALPTSPPTSRQRRLAP